MDAWQVLGLGETRPKSSHNNAVRTVGDGAAESPNFSNDKMKLIN